MKVLCRLDSGSKKRFAVTVLYQKIINYSNVCLGRVGPSLHPSVVHVIKHCTSSAAWGTQVRTLDNVLPDSWTWTEDGQASGLLYVTLPSPLQSSESSLAFPSHHFLCLAPMLPDSPQSVNVASSLLLFILSYLANNNCSHESPSCKYGHSLPGWSAEMCTDPILNIKRGKEDRIVDNYHWQSNFLTMYFQSSLVKLFAITTTNVC